VRGGNQIGKTMSTVQQVKEAMQEPTETIESLTALSNDLMDAINGVEKEMTALGAKRSALKRELRGIHSKLITLNIRQTRGT
jgi:predicted RNase H-like nuclease (RuvC/YqgF family)